VDSLFPLFKLVNSPQSRKATNFRYAKAVRLTKTKKDSDQTRVCWTLCLSKVTQTINTFVVI